MKDKIFSHMKYCLFILLLLLSSCTKSCCDYPICYAADFVMDSYRIKQGKVAIAEMEGRPLRPISCEDLDEYQDVIEEDDILNVVLYHHSRRDLVEAVAFLNTSLGGFRVKEGVIQLPDTPPIEVIGLSLTEAKKVISQKISSEIEGVQVYLSYADRLRKRVELSGLSGITEYPVDGKIRLYEVLSKARLPSGANLFKSYLLRDGEKLGVDFERLLNKGDLCQNVVMRGGDKIFIAHPTDSLVTIMGEVPIPRAVNVPYGYISLKEAIVQAGGIPFTGDKRNIQIIRGSVPSPKIYCIAWEQIIHLPNDSLLLMPGDTVFISEKPITQWNRFIEQLVPSFTGVRMGQDVVYRSVPVGN
jgi:polysaccharide export outer membrane protein